MLRKALLAAAGTALALAFAGQAKADPTGVVALTHYGTAGVSSSTTPAITSGAAVGHFVCAVIVIDSSVSYNSGSWTDARGNTWGEQALNATVNGIKYTLLCSTITTALQVGDTFSMTFATSSGRRFIVVFDVLGATQTDKIAAAGTFGTGGGGTGTPPSIVVPTTGALTNNVEIELVPTFMAGTASAWSESTGWTQLVSDTSSTRNMVTSYRLTTTNAATTYAPDPGNSQGWEQWYFTFSAAAAGAGGGHRNFPSAGAGLQ